MDEQAQPVREARLLVETAGVRRLDDQALLRVHGDDARTWLNGQITSDLRRSSDHEAVYALVVNLKGRVLTDLWVMNRADDVLLSLPAERLDAIQAHFDKYIIMEDVELEPLDGQSVITVQGPACAEVVCAADVDAWSCDRLGIKGWDVIAHATEADAIQARLALAANAIGGGEISEAGWELARIRLGRPVYGRDFGEDTYPQEAGLKEMAVAFDKGCYQGQEAIVMLEHRGKPPKKLVQLELDSTFAPPKGTPITREDGTRIGLLTSAMADPDRPGRALALGYVRRDHGEAGKKVHCGEAEASILRVLGG